MEGNSCDKPKPQINSKCVEALTKNMNTFKTATQISHQYEMALGDASERVLLQRLPPIHAGPTVPPAGGYKTTTMVDFVEKPLPVGPQDINCPPPHDCTLIDKNLKYRIVPYPGYTEYVEKYRPNMMEDPRPSVTVEGMTSVPLVTVGIDEREYVDYKDHVTKHLDIYVTTQRGDFRRYDFDELSSPLYAKNIMTFYDSVEGLKMKGHKDKTYCGFELSRRDVPMVDTIPGLRTVRKVRINPKVVPRVPYTGMESEMQSNYQPPCFKKREFNVSLPIEPVEPPSVPQALATPGMYKSEQDIIHSHKSPQSVVD